MLRKKAADGLILWKKDLVTLINKGIAAREFRSGIWLKAWGVSYVVVIPSILFIAPRVQGAVDYVFRERQ